MISHRGCVFGERATGVTLCSWEYVVSVSSGAVCVGRGFPLPYSLGGFEVVLCPSVRLLVSPLFTFLLGFRGFYLQHNTLPPPVSPLNSQSSSSSCWLSLITVVLCLFTNGFQGNRVLMNVNLTREAAYYFSLGQHELISLSCSPAVFLLRRRKIRKGNILAVINTNSIHLGLLVFVLECVCRAWVHLVQSLRVQECRVNRSPAFQRILKAYYF